MLKKSIYDCLNYFNKDVLIDLSEKMGISLSSKLLKDEIIEEIIMFNGIEDLNRIFENANKNFLIDLNVYFKLEFSSKDNKDILIANINKYLNINKTAGYEFRKQNILSKINTNISYEELIEIIQGIDYSKYLRKLKGEADFKNMLIKELKDRNLNVCTELKIGNLWNLSIDIDINNCQFGIELKIWKSMNQKEILRALGQSLMYTMQKYKDGNYLFLIFGTEKELDKVNSENKIKVLAKMIESIHGKLHFQVYK